MFAHASKRPLPVGFILEPQGNKLTGPIDEIIERNRPKGAISRNEAVFMVRMEDMEDVDFGQIGIGEDDFLHIVEPLGIVQEYDSYLIDTALYDLQNGKVADAEESIQRYWAGDSTESGSEEYLTPKAKVIRPLGRVGDIMDSMYEEVQEIKMRAGL